MQLKVLFLHNYYQQPGGEDTVFRAESSLLRRHGHTVIEYIEDNDRIADLNEVRLAAHTVWSMESRRRVAALLSQEKPDVAHFHNTFPLISPSAYYACRAAGVPVIQSLDNPRLLCPSANFFRDGYLCQDCLGKTPPWPSVWHACYHHSRRQTAVVASMLTFHRWLRTWQERVDLYLVATEFYRRKFIEGGLPPQKIVVKPHFLPNDPGCEDMAQPGEYALFVGRLDPEKGVRILLQAWDRIEMPLKIRGSGQLEQEIRDFMRLHPRKPIELVGRLPESELQQLHKGARFLVWPSDGFYETFGMVAVESFAHGVPVIASRIGVMREVVENGVSGLLFDPGDPEDLARKVQWAWEHPEAMLQMGRNARRSYEARYTAGKNYEQLLTIYQRAVARKA